MSRIAKKAGIDPARKGAALAVASRGMNMAEIAYELGVSRQTLYRWLSEAEHAPDTERAADLREIMGARREGLRSYLDNVRALAGDVDPRIALSASTWLLERLEPDVYGSRAVVKVERVKDRLAAILAASAQREGELLDAIKKELRRALNGESMAAIEAVERVEGGLRPTSLDIHERAQALHAQGG